MSKLNDRLTKALERDPGIVAGPKDVDQHPGRDEAYLKDLGLTKGDLVKLERYGMALRGRTENGIGLFEKEGKIYKEFGSGQRVRWILFAPGELK